MFFCMTWKDWNGDNLLEGENTTVKVECAGPEQNDAVHFLGFMRKKFFHTLLISLILKFHSNTKILRKSIPVRPSQNHPNIIDRARVSLTNVNDDARVLILLKSDFTSFFFRLNHNVRLSDQQLFDVQVRANFDGCVCRGRLKSATHCVVDALHRLDGVLIYDQFVALFLRGGCSCVWWAGTCVHAVCDSADDAFWFLLLRHYVRWWVVCLAVWCVTHILCDLFKTRIL